MNNKLEFHYIVCIIFLEKSYYFLWKDNLFFISDINNKLLFKNNENDLILTAKSHKLSVSDQETHTIDIDHAFKILKQMRCDRSLSERSSHVLLDCLNVLEDMAKTLKIPVGIQTHEENTSLNHIYDKIFWGNNLPAITPEGKSYSPVLLPNEIKIIREYLRGLWDKIYLNLLSDDDLTPAKLV